MESAGLSGLVVHSACIDSHRRGGGSFIVALEHFQCSLASCQLSDHFVCCRYAVAPRERKHHR